MSENDSVVVSGEANVRGAQMLAWRSALGLEAKGFKRSRRSVLSIVREQEIDLGMGWQPLVTARTAREAYDQLNAVIVKLFGEQLNRPFRG